MKKILMITTGGTIACRAGENGLAPALSPDELLSYIPSVKEICEVDAISACHLDSTNITPYHWDLMVRAIEENYEKYDGFVICHGTDTLAYTGAALSYMIQNSKKPIVITGAQKPIDTVVTDAKTNLLDSFIYACDDQSQNVSIVFDGKVIVGTRARKERTKSFNAFSSLNYPFTAVIVDGMLVRYIEEKELEGDVRFYHNMCESICTLKMIPGMRGDILSYLFENYDCIVLESFGVGGIPQKMTEAFYREMEKWQGRGKYVVMTTQSAKEGSHMTVYEVGQRVKRDFRLIEAYDMSFEATITKMMWILGLGENTYDTVREKFYTQINHDILFTKRIENE